MFKTSEQTELIDLALAKVQGELDGAKKDSVNPHFRTKYANISSIFEACRAALAKFDVSVTQWPIHVPDNGQMLHMITRLAHKGQWIMAESSIPISKKDAQGYGSSITYLRRYSLSAALGVADEDDDGEAAVGRKPPETQVQPLRPANAPTYNEAYGTITSNQKVALLDLAKKKGIDLVMHLDPQSLDGLSQAEAAKQWAILKNK